MNQYLDAAIKAARAAGALVRENFGRPLKVNVEEAHDIKLELDVRSQALVTDYQGTRAPINILKAEFDNLRASQPQIPHKPAVLQLWRLDLISGLLRCSDVPCPIDFRTVQVAPV